MRYNSVAGCSSTGSLEQCQKAAGRPKKRVFLENFALLRAAEDFFIP
ncbi:hypothetical protein PSE_4754 [Pseudovibrio sp. FO-BEG1]|nr:hypothetical protein PSE_4754 [Pseudovibrio sp. FO-BEG1]